MSSHQTMRWLIMSAGGLVAAYQLCMRCCGCCSTLAREAMQSTLAFMSMASAHGCCVCVMVAGSSNMGMHGFDGCLLEN